MSALVSDTRAIGLPTSMTVERPTSSDTGMASETPAASRAGGSAGGACASTVADPDIQTMRMLMPNFFVIGSALLVNDFVGSAIAADDLDGRRRWRCGAARGRPWCDRARRRIAKQDGRTDTGSGGRRLVQRIPERELNLSLRARQRQTLGFHRTDLERDDAHGDRLVV